METPNLSNGTNTDVLKLSSQIFELVHNTLMDFADPFASCTLPTWSRTRLSSNKHINRGAAVVVTLYREVWTTYHTWTAIVYVTSQTKSQYKSLCNTDLLIDYVTD